MSETIGYPPTVEQLQQRVADLSGEVEGLRKALREDGLRKEALTRMQAACERYRAEIARLTAERDEWKKRSQTAEWHKERLLQAVRQAQSYLEIVAGPGERSRAIGSDRSVLCFLGALIL